MVKKWAKTNILDILGLLPYVLGGAVVIGAFLSELALYQIGLLVLVIFGFVFWGINQYRTFRTNRIKGFDKQSNEQIVNTLQKWLLEQGFTITSDPQPQEHFQFIARDPQGRAAIISRSKDFGVVLHLWANLLVSEEEQKKFISFPQPVRVDIIKQTRLEMLRFGIQYEGITDPLKQVRLHDYALVDDSLTEFTFFNRIGFIIRAQMLLQEVISLVVQQSEQKQEKITEQGLDKEGSQPE